jgi:hypothetical protein
MEEYLAAKALAEEAIAVAKTAKTTPKSTTPDRKNPFFTIKLPDCATKDTNQAKIG